MGEVEVAVVVHGESAAHVLLAEPGGKAEQVLRCIAEGSSARYPRACEGWQVNGASGIAITRGLVRIRNAQEKFLLVIAPQNLRVKRMVVLRDCPHSSRLSVKPAALTNGGVYYLEVGSDAPEHRLQGFAHQIVAAFIVHGNGWCDRRSETFDAPWGRIPARTKNRRGGEQVRERHAIRQARRNAHPHDPVRYRADATPSF